MKTTEKQEQLKQLLYHLVNAQATERLSLIEGLKKESQDIYYLVLEEFNRLASSLKKKQNQQRREQLVVVYASISGIKALIEAQYPHLMA
jgi:hypothetical protein